MISIDSGIVIIFHDSVTKQYVVKYDYFQNDRIYDDIEICGTYEELARFLKTGLQADLNNIEVIESNEDKAMVQSNS